MKVREIMTTEVATGSPDTTLEELATMMRDEDVGAIPIVAEGELTGIITDRDIVVRCIAEGKDPSEVTAEEVISEDLQIIAPEDEVEDASRIMAERQIRRLPVVEEGRLVGVVSIGDVAVKHGDERVSGEALQEVSKGVKQSGRKRAVRGKGQGIANQSREREEKRQKRVVPIRSEAAVPERRGMHRGGGKAKRRRVS